MAATQATDRRSRKRDRAHSAILDAARIEMADKGMVDATMAEIAERADVALGTLYNHFNSKEQLALAVMEAEIRDVGASIAAVTAGFDDPAHVFAHGVRTVIRHATTNDRWRQLLQRPEVVVDSFRRGFGPYATLDIQRAVDAGRFEVGDIAIAWNLVVWAIVGASEAICEDRIEATQLDDAVTTILGLVGMDPTEATQVVASIPTANDHTSNEPGRT